MAAASARGAALIDICRRSRWPPWYRRPPFRWSPARSSTSARGSARSTSRRGSRTRSWRRFAAGRSSRSGSTSAPTDASSAAVRGRERQRRADARTSRREWTCHRTRRIRSGAHARGVSLRLNQTRADAGGVRHGSEPARDPLRIGATRSSPVRPRAALTAAPCTSSAARGPQMAVRITGSTGRIRVLRFDTGASAWRP